MAKIKLDEVINVIESLAEDAAEQYPDPIYSGEFAEVLIAELKEKFDA